MQNTKTETKKNVGGVRKGKVGKGVKPPLWDKRFRSTLRRERKGGKRERNQEERIRQRKQEGKKKRKRKKERKIRNPLINIELITENNWKEGMIRKEMTEKKKKERKETQTLKNRFVRINSMVLISKIFNCFQKRFPTIKKSTLSICKHFGIFPFPIFTPKPTLRSCEGENHILHKNCPCFQVLWKNSEYR